MVDAEVKNKYKGLFKAIREDLYAEVIMASLFENELIDPAQVVYKPLGIFKRGFKKDLDQLEVIEAKNHLHPQLYIGLNREGLYDMLPEGLFHTNIRKTFHIDTEESVKELKIHEEEEKRARKFFLPFEQEFFRNKISIEQKEKSFAFGFTDPLLQDLLCKFWDLPFLSDEARVNLLYLIPVAHRFVGDLEFTEKIYELVLNEPVTIKISGEEPGRSGYQGIIDSSVLGQDFILDDDIEEGLPCMKVFVGPLRQKEKLLEFIAGGEFNTLLNLIEDYFMPLDVNVEIEIRMDQPDNYFVFSDEDVTGRLSYSTNI